MSAMEQVEEQGSGTPPRPDPVPETIEAELMEISASADDTIKLERIIAWCASHPDEVPFALHQLLGRRESHSPKTHES